MAPHAPVRQVIRVDMDVGEFIQNVVRPSCCDDTSLDWETYNVLAAAVHRGETNEVSWAICDIP